MEERQAALQHLNVAERLDTAVRVVSPGVSLVVAAAGVLITIGLVWAFYGRVPSRVYGDGILLQNGQVLDVTSMADGQVQHIAVAVGDSVRRDDVIAYIDQPELKKQQSLLQARFDELGMRSAQLANLAQKHRELKEAVLARRRTAVAYAIGEGGEELKLYEKKVASEEALLAQGLTTPSNLAEARQKVLTLRDFINTRHADRQDIAFSALDSTKVLEEQRFDLAIKLSDVRRELEELEKKNDTQGVVLAKASGQIIELKVTDGDAVIRGRPIATIEVASPERGDLVAQVYVPVQDGKRVKSGMPIKLAPSVVKPEEYGYLDGVVDSVSPYPTSEESMFRAVRNGSLVTSLLKAGPVYELRVHVHVDNGTPSGLKWSNGRGPAIRIASGTPVRGLVTVRTRRPIELVLPAFERALMDTPTNEAEQR